MSIWNSHANATEIRMSGIMPHASNLTTIFLGDIDVKVIAGIHPSPDLTLLVIVAASVVSSMSPSDQCSPLASL
jgi:hypothetical protein